MLSVIIPFRDKHNLLKNCLDSIKTSEPRVNLEIILVNNNSCEENTFKYLDKIKNNFLFEINIINDDSNPFNYSKAVNYGVSLAKYDKVIIINSDVEIKTKYWGVIISKLLEDNRIGIIGSKLLNQDGSIQHLGIEFDLEFGAKEITLNPKVKENQKNSLYLETKAVTGAFMALRKDTYYKLGGMNEYIFPLTFNDVHLCLKSLEKGYKNVCITDFNIFHKRKATRDSIKKNLKSIFKRKQEKLFIKLRIIFHLFLVKLN